MFRWVLVMLTILGLGLFGVPLAHAGPRVALPEADFDFGVIKEGEKATHVFKIVNTGDEPLQIGEVKADCGCTATSLSHTSLAPNETGEVKVTFDSRNRLGNFQKNVRIFTNDPQQSSSSVLIRGTVQRGPAPVLVVPSRKLDFGVISLNCPFDFDLEVQNGGTETLTVRSIRNLRGEIVWNSEVTVPPQGKETLRLTYHPAMPGIINESLTVLSNDPNNPQFYVFLTGYVDREEKVTVYQPRGQSAVVANSTGSKITVTSKEGEGGARTIDPYQRAAIALGAGEARSELTILFEEKEGKEAEKEQGKEEPDSRRKWYQIFE
jgi:hypothetical protein